MSIVGDWHGDDTPVHDTPYVLCGTDFGDSVYGDDSWSNVNYSGGSWGYAYATAYNDGWEPPGVPWTEVCSMVWANSSRTLEAAAWKNGSIVSWYPTLTLERWVLRSAYIVSDWDDDGRIGPWTASELPWTYPFPVTIEYEDTPENTGWWFSSYQEDNLYPAYLKPPYLIESSYFFGYFAHTPYADDPDFVSGGTYDYYLAPDDIGNFSEDGTAFLSETSAASSAAAAAAGLAHGKVWKSGDFDLLRTAVGSSTFIGSTALDGTGSLDEFRIDTPAADHYGRPHVRFIAQPTSTSTDPEVIYEPLPDPHDMTVTDDTLLVRTGPNLAVPAEDGQNWFPIGPAWMTYKPEYKPLKWRATYSYFYLHTTTGIEGLVNVDAMKATVDEFFWIGKEDDDWIADLRYTVNWDYYGTGRHITYRTAADVIDALHAGHIYKRGGNPVLRVTVRKPSTGETIIEQMTFTIDAPTVQNTMTGEPLDNQAMLPHVRIAAG